MALWNQFRSILFGGAIGAAARTAIEPQIEPARQLAWSNNRNRILDLGVLAELVAEGAVSPDGVADLVHRHGYETDALDALTELSLHAPDLGLLMQARRRGDLSAVGFEEGLAKMKVKPEFRPAIRALLTTRLSPADVANAVQQGFVPGAGLLPDDPGGAQPFTPPVEEVPLDTLDEFAAGGVPSDRARVLAQLVGLPPGPMELLEMWRRGIITAAAVEHGIREGHTKTKWTSALKALRWRVLSAPEYAGLWLRGWITRAEAIEGGALTGYDAEAMDLLYKNRGRPATVRQAHIGYVRGGRLAEIGDDERATILRAVQESNIRSEWFDILYAQRFTYPSAFVVRALASDGTFSPALTEKILLESGWKAEWAKLAAEKWGAQTGGSVQKWADRARTRLFTVTHNEFMDGSIDEATARAKLAKVGALDAEQDAVIEAWMEEAEISRLELTPAQIRKAYKKTLYTQEVAIAELIERGMTPEDAETFLQSG